MSWLNTWTNPSKLQKISIACFVIGWIIIGVFAIFLPQYIQHVKNSGVEEGLVVDSYDDDDYQDWLTTTDSDDIPERYYYTFFHIENAEDLVSTTPDAVPARWRVSAFGPYSYREYCRKHNVTFEEDGKYAKYTEHCWLIYDDKDTNKGRSPSEYLNPLKDLITAINPMYLTLATEFGGEEGLESLLNLICYTVPSIYDDAPNCNQFGLPTPSGAILTMGVLFGIHFPDDPPFGGILPTFFTNDFEFHYGQGGGSGLFVTRTVEQWLLGQTHQDSISSALPFFDPLLFLLRFTPPVTLDHLEELSGLSVPRPLVSVPLFAYKINMTETQFFASNPGFDMRYTGKGDLDVFMNHKMWEGNEAIYRVGDPRGPNHMPGGGSFPGWGAEVAIDGVQSPVHFKSNPSKDDIFTVWLSDAIRPMHFSYDVKTKTSVGNIEVIRFLSRPEDFYNVRYNPANAIYSHWENLPNYIAPYQPIAGVVLYAGKTLLL